MKILSSWDDAPAEDIHLAELMDKYEIETTFYWPVHPESCNEPKGRKSLSAAQMQEIAHRFEIGSHTVTHPLLTRVPTARAADEIFNSKILLEDRFNRKIDKFCYPRGYTNPHIEHMVMDAGYISGRSTVVGYIHESENPFFEQTTVHVGRNRKEYGGMGWMEYAYAMLDEAIKTPDSIYHLWGHGWELEEANAWQDLEDLLVRISKA